jgi:hypothetical protein
MTCRYLQAPLLDVARGVAIPVAVQRAVEAHVAACPRCAEQLRRQRDLTARLHAVAGSTPEWTASDATERRLLDAFAATAARTTSPAPAIRKTAPAQWWLVPATAAAAALLGLWFVVRDAPVAPEESQNPVPPAVTRPAPAVNAPPVSARVEPAPPTERRTVPPRRRSAAREQMIEFMPIPSAAGLPAFESGAIVRMDVPIPELPNYGVHIIPDAARQAVEAEVLVGQDGMARAIRLVASHTERDASRSRQ